MGFPRWLNIVIQGVGTATILGSQFAPLFPPGVAPKVDVGIAIGQAIAGILAHQYNPDGTPAVVPYVKQDG